MSRRFLPREGLYIDPIASGFKKILQGLAIALPLLVAVRTPSIFSGYGSDHPSQSEPFFTVLIVLALIGALLHANDYLSRRAKNNYVDDEIWRGDWVGEIVLITGAASEGGIGSSIVRRLSQRSIKIVVLDIAPMAYKAGPNVHYYQCDLSDSKAIARTCAMIRTEHGHPTILINNAGLSRCRLVADGSYYDKDLTIRVNLLAPFFLIQECLPYMIEHNHGHIFSISSMSAFAPPPGIADYAASKAGLIALHEV